MKLTLVQAPCSQPDTDAVVHQDFHAVRPAVGKGKRSAGAHVHRLGGEPDGIDANHWARPRIKHAQPSGSEAGHFTVIDLSPRGSEMITISSDARLGTTFTGTKAGKVAGD